MPVLVNHQMLVNAFEYAIEQSRKDGIFVVDSLIDWRNNYSFNSRITKLYGAITHHTAAEVSSSSMVNYVRSLGDGSLIPSIGKVLCNTSTVRAGKWPGSDGKPTIIILAADYTNHAGLGDDAVLTELNDGDVDILSEIKPGTDDLYLNRYFLGDEGVGSYTDASQQKAFIVFYGHLFWKLGLAADVDNDGKFAPIIAHRESTRRKVDPSNADLVKMRMAMQTFIEQRYLDDQESTDIQSPDTFKNPYVPIAVDGIWGNKTTRALQYALSYHHNVAGLTGPLSVDGLLGPNTYRALQRLLNYKNVGPVSEDGIFGRSTKKALQRYVGAAVDGIVGPETIRKMQIKINNGF